MSLASCDPIELLRNPMPPLLLAIAPKVLLGLVPLRILLMFCLGFAP